MKVRTATQKAQSLSMLLSGDRQKTLNRVQLKPGLRSLDQNQDLDWRPQIHRYTFYEGKGSVALADGSVHVIDGSGLRELLANSGMPSNRLAIP